MKRVQIKFLMAHSTQKNGCIGVNQTFHTSSPYVLCPYNIPGSGRSFTIYWQIDYILLIDKNVYIINIMKGSCSCLWTPLTLVSGWSKVFEIKVVLYLNIYV